MEEAYKAITSPAWWVGVVIVGLIINLAAAYLKPRLDQAASSVSLRWATRTEEQRRQRLERIEGLRGNIHEQLFAFFSALSDGIHAIISISLAMLLSLFIFILMYLSGVSIVMIPLLLTVLLTVLMGMMQSSNFTRIVFEIREARRSEDRHDQANA
jgi:hypothetical protein